MSFVKVSNFDECFVNGDLSDNFDAEFNTIFNNLRVDQKVDEEFDEIVKGLSDSDYSLGSGSQEIDEDFLNGLGDVRGDQKVAGSDCTSDGDRELDETSDFSSDFGSELEYFSAECSPTNDNPPGFKERPLVGSNFENTRTNEIPRYLKNKSVIGSRPLAPRLQAIIREDRVFAFQNPITRKLEDDSNNETRFEVPLRDEGKISEPDGEQTQVIDLEESKFNNSEETATFKKSISDAKEDSKQISSLQPVLSPGSSVEDFGTSKLSIQEKIGSKKDPGHIDFSTDTSGEVCFNENKDSDQSVSSDLEVNDADNEAVSSSEETSMSNYESNPSPALKWRAATKNSTMEKEDPNQILSIRHKDIPFLKMTEKNNALLPLKRHSIGNDDLIQIIKNKSRSKPRRMTLVDDWRRSSVNESDAAFYGPCKETVTDNFHELEDLTREDSESEEPINVLDRIRLFETLRKKMKGLVPEKRRSESGRGRKRWPSLVEGGREETNAEDSMERMERCLNREPEPLVENVTNEIDERKMGSDSGGSEKSCSREDPKLRQDPGATEKPTVGVEKCTRFSSEKDEAESGGSRERCREDPKVQGADDNPLDSVTKAAYLVTDGSVVIENRESAQDQACDIDLDQGKEGVIGIVECMQVGEHPGLLILREEGRQSPNSLEAVALTGCSQLEKGIENIAFSDLSEEIRELDGPEISSKIGRNSDTSHLLSSGENIDLSLNVVGNVDSLQSNNPVHLSDKNITRENAKIDQEVTVVQSKRAKAPLAEVEEFELPGDPIDSHSMERTLRKNLTRMNSVSQEEPSKSLGRNRVSFEDLKSSSWEVYGSDGRQNSENPTLDEAKRSMEIVEDEDGAQEILKIRENKMELNNNNNYSDEIIKFPCGVHEINMIGKSGNDKTDEISNKVEKSSSKISPVMEKRCEVQSPLNADSLSGVSLDVRDKKPSIYPPDKNCWVPPHLKKMLEKTVDEEILDIPVSMEQEKTQKGKDFSSKVHDILEEESVTFGTSDNVEPKEEHTVKVFLKDVSVLKEVGEDQKEFLDAAALNRVRKDSKTTDHNTPASIQSNEAISQTPKNPESTRVNDETDIVQVLVTPGPMIKNLSEDRKYLKLDTPSTTRTNNDTGRFATPDIENRNLPDDNSSPISNIAVSSRVDNNAGKLELSGAPHTMIKNIPETQKDSISDTAVPTMINVHGGRFEALDTPELVKENLPKDETDPILDIPVLPIRRIDLPLNRVSSPTAMNRTLYFKKRHSDEVDNLLNKFGSSMGVDDVYESVYHDRMVRGRSLDSPCTPPPVLPQPSVKDISDHLEITHVKDTVDSKQIFPKSPDTVNFEAEVGRKLTLPAEDSLDLPEIVDASKRITKSKAKKRKGKSKIPQRQDSKEVKEEEAKGSQPAPVDDVVWDFDERKEKEEAFLKEERLRQAGYDTANGKSKDSGESGTESESAGSPLKHAVLSSPGKRTIASSSSAGSDVALHEGAELSPDDNTDVVGSDGLRQSMQNILDQFMNEERRFDNQ